MMPARLLKPSEAGDGSYAGRLLAAFDALRAEHPERDQLPLPLPRPDELFGDDNVIPFAPIGAGARPGDPR